MDINEKNFRETMAMFPTGVTVVTARTPEGIDFGLTISSFTSLSLSPPQILFCLSRSSHTLPFFDIGFSFVVNILSADQSDLCHHFSKSYASSVPTDWDSLSRIRHSSSGCRLLEGALAYVICQVDTCHVSGDHQIIVGTVRDLIKQDSVLTPLIRHNRQYCQLRPMILPD